MYGGLIERYVPEQFLPYVQLARIDRPVGWWLLLLPCWWSSALAAVSAGQGPHLGHLLLFLIGAIAMRGAGSTFNDIVDRKLDLAVERTRGRPIPSGRVSPFAAVVFLVLQALIGFFVFLMFNALTIWMGIVSLVLVAIYPFMKRITSWPQAVLGLAFSWGALVGWTALQDSLGVAPVLLYAGAIFWTMGYDTIYALQDVRDDSIAGIKSTARLFGENVKSGVAKLYAASVVLITLALWLGHAHIFAYVSGVGFAAHLIWQVRKINPASPQIALELFRSNRNAGLILFAGIFADALTNVLA